MDENDEKREVKVEGGGGGREGHGRSKGNKAKRRLREKLSR
jgi:hypothetical protein